MHGRKPKPGSKIEYFEGQPFQWHLKTTRYDYCPECGGEICHGGKYRSCGECNLQWVKVVMPKAFREHCVALQRTEKLNERNTDPEIMCTEEYGVTLKHGGRLWRLVEK